MKLYKTVRSMRPHIKAVKEILGDRLKSVIMPKSRYEGYWWKHVISSEREISFRMRRERGSYARNYICWLGPDSKYICIGDYIEELDEESQKIILFNLDLFDV